MPPALFGSVQKRIVRISLRACPERHRWRHPQSFVRAAQVVERDVQAHGRQVAVNLFGEAVAKAREPL
jgi:hypothetical protein